MSAGRSCSQIAAWLRIGSLLTGIAVSSTVMAAEDWVQGVTATATSAQVTPLFGAMNVVNEHGFQETSPGSGQFQLTTNAYANGGSAWHSNYLPSGPDENAIIEFDFGKTVTIGEFRVWNYNGNPGRGFRHVEITAADEHGRWLAWAERFEFAKAPNRDDYLGENYRLAVPVTARKLRFHCLQTHRQGGNRELAGLGKVRFKTAAPSTTTARFNDWSDRPADVGWINVKQPPYHARGDGQTDDTAALQRAIDDWQGTAATLFIPKGTYRLTRSLKLTPGKGFGYTSLRGAGRDQTILRLDDGVAQNKEQPVPVVSFAFNGQPDGKGVHADWFNNNLSDLTIVVGADNPHAIGLQYYSNNVGSLRRTTIRTEGGGAIGLDLGYADQNGPLLVQHVNVVGFRLGLRTGATVNSQTLEHVQLSGYTEAGFRNQGQCLAVRKLLCDGAGPAFENPFGIVCLIDSSLAATSDVGKYPAIITRDTLFARNIRTDHYRMAIENTRDDGTPSVTTAMVDEFVSKPAFTLLSQRQRSLGLPIEETPDAPLLTADDWANVRHFRELSDPDDSQALQRAIDSGKRGVYFPSRGSFLLGDPVQIRGQVEVVVGHFANLNQRHGGQPALIVGPQAKPLVCFEQIKGHVTVEHRGAGRIVARDTQGLEGLVTGPGDVFLDNVVGEWSFGKGRAWCRQFNTEREGTHAINAGGKLWILGLKTERGGTLVETQPGGETEILGGLSYTTTKGQLAPMFTATDAALSVMIGEVCYNGDPYRQLVRITRNGKSEELPRGPNTTRAAFLGGSVLPLFVSAP